MKQPGRRYNFFKSRMVSFKLASLLLIIGNTNAKQTFIRGKNRLAKAKSEAGLDAEDVEFWTRMMQVASLPLTDRPTRRPSARPSNRPSNRPTPR